MKNNHKYRKKITSSYSDIGPSGQLKIAALFNLLQDAGAEHAERLNISGFDLARKDLFWVISRYRINIAKNPRLNEPLEITTWRSSLNNLYDLRWFTINDGTGETIVDALGSWVMVNKTRGTPCRLSRFIPDHLLSGKNSRAIDHYFPRLSLLTSADVEHRFKIRMHDLDLNRHVNNAVYIEWAAETVPEEMLARYTPEKIDVHYFKESFYPDNIVSATEIHRGGGTPVTHHSIKRAAHQTELARLHISWRPMEAL